MVSSDEDDDIALLDAAVDGTVVDGLDELVRHTVIVRLLHGGNHVGRLLAFALDQQVVGFLDTLPALVAVHSIEAAHDAGDGCVVLGADVSNLLDEALARLGVGVAAIHETMYERLVLQSVVLAYLNEFEKVVEAGVYAAVRAESHEVQLLALFFGIGIGSLHLGVLHDGVVAAGTVNLHEVLIDDASCTDIEVTHLRVAHLSVGQTNVLATGLQLRVSRNGCQIVQIRGRCTINNVTLTMFSDSPSVENHQ